MDSPPSVTPSLDQRCTLHTTDEQAAYDGDANTLCSVRLYEPLPNTGNGCTTGGCSFMAGESMGELEAGGVQHSPTCAHSLTHLLTPHRAIPRPRRCFQKSTSASRTGEMDGHYPGVGSLDHEGNLWLKAPLTVLPIPRTARISELPWLAPRTQVSRMPRLCVKGLGVSIVSGPRFPSDASLPRHAHGRVFPFMNRDAARVQRLHLGEALDGCGL